MLKILVVASDGDDTIRPMDCPFAIWARGMGRDYDCGIPTAKEWGSECKCESEGECPYLELCVKPLDK